MHTFNRTILELKLQERTPILVGCGSFNRTILELKQWISWQIPDQEITFNRTILELKLVLKIPRFLHNNPFNRTILELKQILHVEPYPVNFLLIEPFWN